MHRRLSRPGGVQRVAAEYGRMETTERSRFHDLYCRLFVGRTFASADVWRVPFQGGEVSFPLRPGSIETDWANAIAALGHDPEVKDTYLALMSSPERPDLFLDVGGNFGTHSLLFLKAGIATVTFEPNPECHSYFETLAALNEVSPRLEKVAIGDSSGEIELVFPGGATWLGSADPEVQARLGADVRRIKAPLVTLNSYMPEFAPYQRILMKVDVEGLEEKVFLGADRLFAEKELKVVFESNELSRRPAMYRLLADRGYRVQTLPWRANEPRPGLSEAEFRTSKATNFMALRA
jgi:FkbM family methyltransferase